MTNQREIALKIICKTIQDESYSNLLMRQELNALPQVQRAFCTNLVNSVLRKYEELNYQIKDEISSTSLKNRIILCMAIYERFFLNEKDYVVNNEYVELCKNKYDKAFVNALLHKIKEYKVPNEDYVKANLPEWIYKLLSSQYEQDKLQDILNMYQNVPNLYYRLNKNKCSYDDLKDLGIETIDDEVFTCKNNLLHTILYDKGYFYIQDYNSASLCKNLDLKQDNTLLDVCSAPGSKLFNCLDILKDSNCYANDIYAHRVELIKKMANKLGYNNINYSVCDGTSLQYKYLFKFDRIMLDAPCSGLGVIGRKPDLKFHVKPEGLDDLQTLQYNLLDSVKGMLKVNGILLYSTCTLNRKENDKQITNFLRSNANYVLEKQDTIINDMGDGFYFAKLRKIADD